MLYQRSSQEGKLSLSTVIMHRICSPRGPPWKVKGPKPSCFWAYWEPFWHQSPKELKVNFQRPSESHSGSRAQNSSCINLLSKALQRHATWGIHEPGKVYFQSTCCKSPWQTSLSKSLGLTSFANLLVLPLWQTSWLNLFDKPPGQTSLAIPVGKPIWQTVLANLFDKPLWLIYLANLFGKPLGLTSLANLLAKPLWQTCWANILGNTPWQTYLANLFGEPIWQTSLANLFGWSI